MHKIPIGGMGGSGGFLKSLDRIYNCNGFVKQVQLKSTFLDAKVKNPIWAPRETQ